MLDPLTALGVAGNVLQLIDFSVKLVSEGNEIYHTANGVLNENKDAGDLAHDLSILTRNLSVAQQKWVDEHGQAALDPDEVRLRNICDRATEISVELQNHLKKLEVPKDAKHRRFKSYKQALLSVWRKDQLESIAGRLEKYQQEIDTQILFGLRRSAQEANVKATAQFEALDDQTKKLTLAVLDSGTKMDSRLSDQADVLARIHDHTTQILSTMETERRRSPSPLPAYEAVAGSSISTALHEAAGSGDVLRVRQLLRSNVVDVNARDEYGGTPLHVASTGEVAKRLLADKRTDLSIEDNDGRSSLHCAVLKRRLDVIKALLEAGIDQTLEDDLGRAAIFYASNCLTADWMLRYGHETEAKASMHLNNTGLLQLAWVGDLEGVEFYIKHGGDVNYRNLWGETALTETSRHGNARLVELLIAHGANLEIAADDQWTPLLQAIRDNRKEVVEILLRYGAKKEARLKSGNNSLSEACWRSNYDIARVLIEAGSSIETPDLAQRTPLVKAAMDGKSSSVRWLLSRGANHAAKDVANSTAVYLAAVGNHPKSLQALLEYGANPNIRQNDGFTPLCIAAHKGHYECVKLLLEKGAEINVVGANLSGFTALSESCQHGHIEVVKLLLDKGADWAIGSNSGFSAMSVAANTGQNDIMRVLAGKGADVEQPGFGHKDPAFSKRPLMRAATDGTPSSVETLLELGADIEAKDAQGQTALMYSIEKKRTECTRILLKHGANPNTVSKSLETPLMKAAYHGLKKTAQRLIDAGADPRPKDWRGCTAWTIAGMVAHDDLKPILEFDDSEEKALRQMQAKSHPSVIAAYMNAAQQS